MKIKTHLNSFFLFLTLAVLFISCSNLKLLDIQKIPKNNIIIPENLLIQQPFSKATYKINIDVFHQKMSGMLIVKQNTSNSLRMLMITEFGLKVFDVEYFRGDSIQIYYLMKHLNYPHLVNSIFDNLKVLWPGILTNNSNVYFYNEKKKNKSLTHFDRINNEILIKTKQPTIVIRLKKLNNAFE